MTPNQQAERYADRLLARYAPVAELPGGVRDLVAIAYLEGVIAGTRETAALIRNAPALSEPEPQAGGKPPTPAHLPSRRDAALAETASGSLNARHSVHVRHLESL